MGKKLPIRFIPISNSPFHNFQGLSRIIITHPLFTSPVSVLYNTCKVRSHANKKKEGIFLKKADFIKAVAAKAGTSQKAADTVLAAALATIREALKKDDSVAFLKFGTFKISKRAARKGRNPQTGKPIQIPAAKLPVFKASAAFKELVNGKRAKKK